MTRWLLLAVAVAGCAKGKESAPPPTNASADPPPSSVTSPPPPPPPSGSDPRAEAQEQARNQGGLGVSAQTDAFDQPAEGGSDKGSVKAKSATTERRKEEDGKAAPVVVGGTGGGASTSSTRGYKDKDYRASIVAVTLDGNAAPPALVTAIKANLTKVQTCYDKALAVRPELVGALSIKFTVLPTGALSGGAVATSTVKQPGLETCVITALAATKLAQPLGATDGAAEIKISFKAK